MEKYNFPTQFICSWHFSQIVSRASATQMKGWWNKTKTRKINNKEPIFLQVVALLKPTPWRKTLPPNLSPLKVQWVVLVQPTGLMKTWRNIGSLLFIFLVFVLFHQPLICDYLTKMSTTTNFTVRRCITKNLQQLSLERQHSESSVC